MSSRKKEKKKGIRAKIPIPPGWVGEFECSSRFGLVKLESNTIAKKQLYGKKV